MDNVGALNLLFQAGTLLLIILLLLAMVMHINNLNKVYKLMAKLQHKESVPKDLLYKEMTVPQGMNFTALALASWIMLLVAIAFLYLLVPTYLPLSYMDLSDLASSPMGFAKFGIAVAALVAVVLLFLDKLPENYRNLKLTELYSFYSISKRMKKLIGITVVVLCISIIISSYVGTIYPGRSPSAELLSLILMIISAGILVMPIFKEAWEARR